jgi:hypothetical protein
MDPDGMYQGLALANSVWRIRLVGQHDLAHLCVFFFLPSECSARHGHGRSRPGMNYCFSRSYTYGGVQYGSECWCGNTINKGTFWGIPPDQWIRWGDSYGTLVDYSECQSFPCAGDPSTSCGNHWRNNVFMVSGSNRCIHPLAHIAHTPPR